MLLFSCSWEEYDETKGQTEDSSVADIEIVAAEDLAFPPAGGMGTITLKSGTGVSVETNRSWCHAVLNGNVVNISSDQNPSKQSRYARVTITAGGESIYVTVQQYGEVFSGLEMTDFIAPCEGTDMTLSFLSNMEVNLTSDKDWVSFVKDDEAKTVKIVVAENPGQETRFANIGFTSGTVTGSAKVTQAPTPKSVESWTFAVTGGEFVFPDQIDQITATPGKDVAKYVFTVVGKNDIEGDIDEYIQEDYMPGLITDLVANEPDKLLVDEVTQEYTNLSASVYAIAVGFDKEGYITGQYGYQELSIPDRGPVKTLIEGWDVEITSNTVVSGDQVTTFTITPKTGYESTRYVAAMVKKDAVASGIEDYAFNTVALGTRSDLLAKVESGDLADFNDGLSLGTSTITYNNTSGDCYVVVVAFDNHQFYQGDYTVSELAVDDLTYYRWVGEWEISSTTTTIGTATFAGKETWTISVDTDDTVDGTLTVRGICSLTNSSIKAADGDKMKLTFDKATGAVVLMSQNGTNKFNYSSYGECELRAQGYYTKDGSSFSRVTGTYTIFTATLPKDETSSIVVTPGIRTTGGVDYDYSYFRLMLYRYGTNGYYTLGTSASSGVIPLPFDMKRIEE